MRMHSRKKTSEQGSYFGRASLFILLQLFVVWLIYYLHQRSSSSAHQGKGAAESQAEQTRLLQEKSDGPSAFELNFTTSSPGVNCSSRTVSLREADVDLLRTEVFKITDALISSKALVETAEQGAGSWLTMADQLPPVPIGSQLLRLSDEKHQPNPTSNIPGVQDVHAELREYTEHMLDTWTSDFEAAKKRQQRPTAADLGLQVLDSLEDTESIPDRIAFLNQLAAAAAPENLKIPGSKAAIVAIATTTSVDLLGVRKEILPWLQYHTEVGISQFYILYDGTDHLALESLRSIKHVEIINIHPPWASPEELILWEAHSNLSKLQWQGSQGNYELMSKQAFCLQQALRRAQERNQAASRRAAGLQTEAASELGQRESLQQIDWLMHLDPDELFLPGGNEANIAAELARQPPHIPSVRFLNFEGQPEVGDVVNRFEQVTLFRAHKHFITPEAFWYRNRFKLGENAAFLYLYANGKSAVRVNAPGASHAGPHYFTGDPSERWVSKENPSGLWVNAVSDTSIILHYAYSNPSEVAAKARRSCPGNFTAAAAAGDREVVKKSCFIIEFDADAFMAAVQGQDAVNDFYFSRMVLSEGVAVRCSKPNAAETAVGGGAGGSQGWCALSNIPRFIHLMEKVGLMKRVLLPQAILRQQERFYQNFWLRPLSRN